MPGQNAVFEKIDIKRSKIFKTTSYMIMEVTEMIILHRI